MAATITSKCGKGLETAKIVIRGRWFILAVGIIILIVGSGPYAFSVYSQKLKSALSINQENLNLIANFKDLGVNFGLLSGLLYDYWSPGGVLFLGAVETSVGYSLAWLAVTGKLAPSLWQMCMFLLIAANAQAMLDVVVMVHGVHLFPASKGAIIGLLKGFIGISGAILIQIYTTLFGNGHPESFLLMLVWLPASVALLSILVIRPMSPFRGIPDAKYIYWLLALGFVIAFYLMGVSVTQNLLKVSDRSEKIIGAVLMGLIFIPLGVITYRSEIYGKKSEEDGAGGTGPLTEIAQDRTKPLTEMAQDRTRPLTEKAQDCHEDWENGITESRVAVITPPSPKEDSHGPGDLEASTELSKPSSKPWPRKGEDHTIWQTYRSLDFWLLFIATTFGIGSGLTVTDNMGQLGLSLGYASANVKTFVSLVSIWNAIGRWVGGFTSDILLRHYGFSRALFLALMMTLMAMAFLLIAMAIPGCLYFGSIFLGLSFGAQYPLYATIVADIFGLKFYATLYSSISLASPVGMYVLSVPVVGKFYDAEARHKNGANSNLECLGSSCFRRSLLVLVGVTLGAALCSGVLWFRTRNLYREVHEEYQRVTRDGKANPYPEKKDIVEAEIAKGGF